MRIERVVDLLMLPMLVLGIPLQQRPSAQEVLRSIPDLWEVPSVGIAAQVGPFSWIGDINDDAVSDFVVGQSSLSFDGLLLNGRVRVHSGKDASVLRTYIGSGAFHALGLDVAGFGDLDEDGVPDYLGSRPDGPYSYIWSGADGSELRRIEAFDSKASLGDLDGDGIPSFVTSFGEFGGRGSVLVYDGLDVRYRLNSPSGVVNFGLGLEGLSDLDGDGYADFAAAAPGEDFKGFCERGTVFVYSGREGRLLYRLEGPANEQSMFGWFMASPGDLTGDGLQDLVIAAPLLGRHCLFGGGRGRITFHDGLTGALLGEFDDTQLPIEIWGRFGSYLDVVGDLNGNGFGDVGAAFLSGATHSERRWNVLAIDGGTRELIYVVPHPYGDRCNGYFFNMHAAGDVNDDGFPDFATSTDCLGSPTSRFDILSGNPHGVKSFGKACVDSDGPSPRMGISSPPLVGTDIRFYLSQVAPGQEALLVLGSSATHWGRIPLPIRLPGYGGCPLYVAPEVRVRAIARRIRPGEGAAEVLVSIPNDPALVGSRFYAQWLLRSRPTRSSPRRDPGPYKLHENATTFALGILVQASPFPPLARSATVTPMGVTSPGLGDTARPLRRGRAYEGN